MLNFRMHCRYKQEYSQNFAVVNEQNPQMMTAEKEMSLITLKTVLLSIFSSQKISLKLK